MLSYINGFIVLLCRKLYGSDDINKWTTESISKNITSVKISNCCHDNASEMVTITRKTTSKFSYVVSRIAIKSKSINADVICLHHTLIPFIQLMKLFKNINVFSCGITHNKLLMVPNLNKMENKLNLEIRLLKGRPEFAFIHFKQIKKVLLPDPIIEPNEIQTDGSPTFELDDKPDEKPENEPDNKSIKRNCSQDEQPKKSKRKKHDK